MKTTKNQIAALRKRKGIKQKELAAMLGMKTATLGTWERGQYPFTLDDACKIADVLECTLDELAGRETPKPAFSDPRQEALNGYWESMNTEGQDTVLGMVRLVSTSSEVRIEKEGQPVRLSSAMGA